MAQTHILSPKLKNILHTHKFEYAHRIPENIARLKTWWKTKKWKQFEEQVCRMATQGQSNDALGLRRELYHVDSSTKLYKRTQSKHYLLSNKQEQI
jgi:hypothetical protein